MTVRRAVAVIISAFASTALMVGGGAVLAVPANAVPATYSVTWTGLTLSPDALPSASPGETIGLQNSSAGTINIRNASGQVSDSEGLCDGSSSLCTVSDGITWTFTIVGTGTIAVLDSNGTQLLATLTLGGSGAQERPTVTMTLDANGGGCGDTNPVVESGAIGGAYALPSAAECVRTGFTLLGWSHDADDTEVEPNLVPGATVNFADNGTLFAVWQANDGSATITYDANVAAMDACWDSHGTPVSNVAGFDGGVLRVNGNRTETVTAPVDEPPAPTAVCKPPFLVLTGWNTRANGTGSGYPLDKPLGSQFPKVATLYAQWGLPLVRLSYGYASMVTGQLGALRPLSKAGEPIELATRDPSLPVVIQVVTLDRLGNPAPRTLVPMIALNGPELYQYPSDPAAAQGPAPTWSTFIVADSRADGTTTFLLRPGPATSSGQPSLLTWSGPSSDFSAFLIYPVTVRQPGTSSR